MRVLHISSGNMYGGVETVLATLAVTRQACQQMEPTFAMCFEGRIACELRSAGVPLHLLGAVATRKPWSVVRARRRLKSLLAGRAFDAVICHMPWAMAMFGSTVQRADIPLILWMHGPATGRHWIERWARRTRPALVVCNSEFTAASVPTLWADVERATIYNPVRPAVQGAATDRSRIRAGLDTAEDAVVLIQVSRLEPWKGQTLHLDALAEYRGTAAWTSWIVGGAQTQEEQSYECALQERVKQLGIGHRVRFAGQRTDVSSLLQAADIYCQPNTGPEPFGMSYVEGLSAGLPVISTAIGGALEIVDDSCGILAAPDKQSVAAAVEKLIDNQNLRKALGRNGPARADHLCNPARQLTKLAHELKRVSERNKPHPAQRLQVSST